MTLPTSPQLAGMIDHTLLRPDATYADFARLCAEARDYRFAMVAINPAPVPFCARELAGTGVGVGAAIGFPLGQMTAEVKVYETQDAIQKGATEIDFVINIVELKSGNQTFVADEIARVVRACAGVISKVILETVYLTADEKKLVCRMAVDAGATFVKTSTGFASMGAMPEDVALMKAAVGEQAKVKASGGIRTLDQVAALIAAGAERIGTSRSVELVTQARTKEQTDS
jgi:deoxyribose-phosphate aldolase